MKFNFNGKVAIVTGAGSGIGETIAMQLAEAGADVVIADLNEKAANEVAKKIKTNGYKTLVIQTDVSSSQSVSNLVKQTLEKFNKIDILVNNAGIAEIKTAEEISEAEWDKHISIDLNGTFLCCKAVLKCMIEQKGGKIINIGSIAADRGTYAIPAYSAAKGGVNSLTRALALEWAKYNINVNVVSPGFTMTPINIRIGKEDPAWIKSLLRVIPLNRPNEPEDIAYAAMFLASEEAHNITGQEIIVDGGTTAMHPGGVPEK